MPIYEYACEKCGRIEEWQSFQDATLTACPRCASRVERLLSAGVGLVFKGSGFYINDYQRAGTTDPGEKPPEAPAKADPAPAPAPAGPSATPVPAATSTPVAPPPASAAA